MTTELEKQLADAGITEEQAEYYKLLAKHWDAIDIFREQFIANPENCDPPTEKDIKAEIQRLEKLEATTTEKVAEPVMQKSVPISEVSLPLIKTGSESKNKTQGTKTHAVTLIRQTFTVSRELEYFTERELTTQTGYSRRHWLSVILKELLDNALDACETARIEPDITIGICDGDTLYVKDNGSGIPTETITKILDFSTRTSDKQAYRSPSRGA